MRLPRELAGAWLQPRSSSSRSSSRTTSPAPSTPPTPQVEAAAAEAVAAAPPPLPAAAQSWSGTQSRRWPAGARRQGRPGRRRPHNPSSGEAAASKAARSRPLAVLVARRLATDRLEGRALNAPLPLPPRLPPRLLVGGGGQSPARAGRRAGVPPPPPAPPPPLSAELNRGPWGSGVA